MTAGIRSSTRSKAIPRLAIEQAESFLQELPKKEKEHLPISEAISGISDTVRAALAKGYSYNEISDMLSDKLGISVSAWSLRRYIPAGSRRGKRSAAAEVEAAPKRRRKKAESPAELNGSTPAAIEVPEITPVEAPIIETPSAEPAPSTTRRRATTRGKTTATKAEAEAKPAAKTRTTRSQTAAAKKTSATKTKTGTRTTRSRKQKS